jgi:hypothetical protein
MKYNLSKLFVRLEILKSFLNILRFKKENVCMFCISIPISLSSEGIDYFNGKFGPEDIL